jgi:hypothetical protein
MISRKRFSKEKKLLSPNLTYVRLFDVELREEIFPGSGSRLPFAPFSKVLGGYDQQPEGLAIFLGLLGMMRSVST